MGPKASGEDGLCPAWLMAVRGSGVFTFYEKHINIVSMLGVQTILNSGPTGLIIDIECQLSNGLPGITIVGLGSKAVDEARERVRSAFAASQINMPRKRITINLAPADVPKESTSIDLAIGLAILQADGQLRPNDTNGTAVIGELGLDGKVRAVRGIIGKLMSGQELGLRRFIIPAANFAQARLIPNLEIICATSLKELVSQIAGGNANTIKTNQGYNLNIDGIIYDHKLSDVAGQMLAKRALEVAGAGGHNILLNGPPGTGKSMLAKTLPSILPPLSRQEVLEITQLHSLVNGNYDQLVTHRPFRAPHHSASNVAIVGGGNTLRPGEISLAHRGILFFDELPEFGRVTIEALRQPLEDRTIAIARAKDNVVYPANFILVATANPCPCGYFGTNKACVCPAHLINKYRQKLSGPIMDRIDIYVDVEDIEHRRLLEANQGNDDEVRSRVRTARQMQQGRFGSTVKLNSSMDNRDIKTKSLLKDESTELLNQAAKSLELSARSYMRIIKVARTIADLENSEAILPTHISEALQYRSPNRALL